MHVTKSPACTAHAPRGTFTNSPGHPDGPGSRVRFVITNCVDGSTTTVWRVISVLPSFTCQGPISPMTSIPLAGSTAITVPE